MARHPEASDLKGSRDQSSDPFVGRDRELAVLRKVAGGSQGLRGAALIEGEAGIGKSRLLAEFVESLDTRAIRALTGCCYHVKETGPYFPFLQVLSQLREGSSLTEELVTLLTSKAFGQAEWPESGPEMRSRRARFLRSLSDAILREARAAPTLLCIEDIHSADVGSLLLLNNLLDIRASGLLITCTVRLDEPAEPDVRQLLSRIQQKSRRIALRGLDRRGVWELVRHWSGPGEITEEEVRDLVSYTDGNPMFLRELYLHTRGMGLLERHHLLEAIRRSRTPNTLKHVVDLRLRSLPGEVYGTLAACSVMGIEFSTAAISKATDVPEATVEEHLETCLTAGVLQPADTIGAIGYRFAHQLFPMRLYDMLSVHTRRQLHRQIAEAGDSGAIPLAIEELARHHALGFGTAGGRRSIHHCRAAADQAEKLMAFESAASYWELALRCTAPGWTRIRAELYRRLGRALSAAGNWTRAAEAWKAAVPLFQKIREPACVAELALALGEMYRWRQELEPSERWLQRALSLLPEGSGHRARALALLGSIRCLQDQAHVGLQLCEEANSLALGRPRDPFVAHWLSFGFLACGDPAKAVSVARQGLAEARRRGASAGICLLAATLFHHEFANLRPTAAQSYARLVRNSADPTDTTSLTVALTCRALLLAYSGKWKKVIRLCERWMSQVRLAGRFHVATARMIWAEASLALGDAAAAEIEIRRALQDLEHMRPLAPLHLARALVAQNKIEEAQVIALRYAPTINSNPRFATARVVLGDVASALESSDLWKECYCALSGESGRLMHVYSPISVQRVLGRLASRLKLWPQAIDHFERALEQLRAGRAYGELPRTYLDYADMRRSRRRRGDLAKEAALELQAEAILTELGIDASALHEPPAAGNRFGLTGREIEVLTLVAEGRRNPEIAEVLSLSRRTVDRHLENIYAKMGADNRMDAVMRAVQEGLIGPLSNGPSQQLLGVESWNPRDG